MTLFWQVVKDTGDERVRGNFVEGRGELDELLELLRDEISSAIDAGAIDGSVRPGGSTLVYWTVVQ